MFTVCFTCYCNVQLQHIYVSRTCLVVGVVCTATSMGVAPTQLCIGLLPEALEYAVELCVQIGSNIYAKYEQLLAGAASL